MKYIGYLFIFVLGSILGMAPFLLTSIRPPSTLQVNIHNQSGVPISNIIITGQDGAVILNKLRPYQTKEIPLIMFGEGTYEISATLQNGEVISSQGGYVEPGYRVKEIIKPNSIEHEYISFY